MWTRPAWLLAVFVFALVGCAPSSSPVVDVPASTTALVTISSASAPIVSGVRTTGSAIGEPSGSYCADRGLPVVDMCPEGHETDPGEFLMPEALGVCCGAGPVAGVETQPCFAALYAARACRDKTGERNVQARLELLKNAFGEPCQDKEFRNGSFWLRTFRRICAERGFPPTANDLPHTCGRTDDSCPPQWPRADW